MAYRASPRSRRLGSLLQELRDTAGLKQDDLVMQVNAGQAKPLLSQGHYSRIEAGIKPVDVKLLERIINVLEVDQKATEQLLDIHAKIGKRGWWADYLDILDDTAEQVIELSEEAVTIQAYEPILIQSFLQIEAYSRAILEAGRAFTKPTEIDLILELRARRQQRLTADDFRGLIVVLTEAALRQPIGGRDVMRQQLDHLCAAIENPKIAIYVLPFTNCPWPTMTSTQIFTDRYNNDIAYATDDLKGHLYEDGYTVRNAIYTINAARHQAASGRESLDLIRTIRHEM